MLDRLAFSRVDIGPDLDTLFGFYLLVSHLQVGLRGSTKPNTTMPIKAGAGVAVTPGEVTLSQVETKLELTNIEPLGPIDEIAGIDKCWPDKGPSER